MIVSDNPKFICFQPWKCGSSTLYRRLKKFDNGRYPQTAYFNDVLGKNSHKHIALDDFFKLPESSQNHKRFAFVRNPYDRMYSGYLQRRLRMKNLLLHSHFDEISEENREENRHLEKGFAAFILFVRDRFKRNGEAFGKPLYRHIYYRKKPAIDLAGFVETFDKSFDQICKSIGIPETNSENVNVKYNQGDIETAENFQAARFRYIDKYSRHSIEAVNEIYELDFQCLGYRMLKPIDLDGDWHEINSTLSPFSDAVMPEQFGQIKKFDRHNDLE